MEVSNEEEIIQNELVMVLMNVIIIVVLKYKNYYDLMYQIIVHYFNYYKLDEKLSYDNYFYVLMEFNQNQNVISQINKASLMLKYHSLNQVNYLFITISFSRIVDLDE